MALAPPREKTCETAKSDDDTVSLFPQAVSKHVMSGDFILKVNKKSKGSRAWEQFRLVWDPSKNEEVFGIACCAVCKSCLLYKKSINGEQKSLGTKNMLDHLKNCTPSSRSSRTRAVCDTDSESSSSSSSTGTVVRRVSGMKTLDSFVKRTGKKVGEATKIGIRERTATLVAAAHLPYRFVELESLKHFAQAFIDLGAAYGCVPASDFIAGRLTVRKDIVNKLSLIQETIKESIAGPSKLGAVSCVTDLWSDNVVQRSYLDVTFFWVEESGSDNREWALKHAMYACKFFPDTKTADHIQITLDRILIEVGLDAENVPCTTDKGANMVAATHSKCHINCACHRLSTSINAGWEISCDQSVELNSLNECADNLVKFVKKSGGIQYNLPATLKSGGKTRPWRSLINKFSSIFKSFDALRPLLMDKRREDLIVNIDIVLVEEVLQILGKAETMFDILEYSYISTLQSVLPAYYKLRNSWSEHLSTDSATGRILKRNLVSALDGKMWVDINALHVAASYLDPSLKSFSFVKNTRERKNLLEQAVQAIRENAVSYAGILVTDESGDSDIEDTAESPDSDGASKKAKYDPFAEFRNAVLDTRSGHASTDYEADVDDEFRRYNSISGVSLQQPDAVRSVFDPLLWWGKQRLSFPILSFLARQLLVMPASSAESERHFSGAGRIARKDRNRLKEDAVESTVIYYEATRKGII